MAGDSERWKTMSDLERAQAHRHRRVGELLRKGYSHVRVRDNGDRFLIDEVGSFAVEMSSPERGRLVAVRLTAGPKLEPVPFGKDGELAAALATVMGWFNLSH